MTRTDYRLQRRDLDPTAGSVLSADQGDFASGQRSHHGPVHARGDFATGVSRARATRVTGDFATGIRGSRRSTDWSDFATGMRVTPTARTVVAAPVSVEDPLRAAA